MKLLKALWEKRFIRILTVYGIIAVLLASGIAVWKQSEPVTEDEWMMNAGGVTIEKGDYPACDWENMPGRYEGDALTNAYTAALLVENLGILERGWIIYDAGYSEEEEWVLLHYLFDPGPNDAGVKHIYDIEYVCAFDRATGRFIARGSIV